MEKKQTVKQESYKLIVTESRINPDSLALVPKFFSGVNKLDQITIQIDSEGIKQEKDLKGIKTNKDKKMVNVIDWTIDICGAGHSYAHDTGDDALMERLNYKVSDIKHMAQPELLKVAGVVLDEALLIPADKLALEGISPKDLLAYKDLIVDFSRVKSSTKEAIIDRTGVTEKLSALFDEAETIVKNTLDKLISQYKRKDPDFYRRYKTARAMQVRASQKKTAETNPPV